MWEQTSRIFNQAATRITNGLADFLPGVLVFCLIVLAFGIFAVVARVLVLRLLRGFDFDQRASQLGLAFLGEWSVAGRPSLALARLLFWTIVILGLLAGLTALVARMQSLFALTLFVSLPVLLVALVIVYLGSITGQLIA